MPFFMLLEQVLRAIRIPILFFCLYYELIDWSSERLDELSRISRWYYLRSLDNSRYLLSILPRDSFFNTSLKWGSLLLQRVQYFPIPPAILNTLTNAFLIFFLSPQYCFHEWKARTTSSFLAHVRRCFTTLSMIPLSVSLRFLR